MRNGGRLEAGCSVTGSALAEELKRVGVSSWMTPPRSKVNHLQAAVLKIALADANRRPSMNISTDNIDQYVYIHVSGNY